MQIQAQLFPLNPWNIFIVNLFLFCWFKEKRKKTKATFYVQINLTCIQYKKNDPPNRIGGLYPHMFAITKNPSIFFFFLTAEAQEIPT